jgi:hypothetical protein
MAGSEKETQRTTEFMIIRPLTGFHLWRIRQPGGSAGNRSGGSLRQFQRKILPGDRWLAAETMASASIWKCR